MATYVLVHGAWHGGWCWKKVTPLLRAAGHDVYTPTLTGLGERAHLLTPAVDLEIHTRDVLGVLAYEDLSGVVLVGHSYGGMVITAVAGRAAERLAHLVYLDAFIPADGERLLDLMLPERRATFLEQVRASGEGWQISPQPLEVFGVTDETDLRWAGSKVGPHPLRIFEQPMRIDKPPAASVLRTYIWCSGFPGFARFAERTRTDPGWRYRELATGHDAMITAPRDVAGLLLEAGSPA